MPGSMYLGICIWVYIFRCVYLGIYFWVFNVWVCMSGCVCLGMCVWMFIRWVCQLAIGERVLYRCTLRFYTCEPLSLGSHFPS